MNDLERIRGASMDRVAALLGSGLPGGLVGRLAEMARFAPRLHAAAASRLDDLPSLEPRQSAALALNKDDLRGIIFQAGAVWYGATLARVVDGAARREVIRSLGPAYALALEGRGRSLGGGTTDLPPGDLAEAAKTEGECCWAAWRDSQPPPVAARLLLLDCDNTPQAVHWNFGPAIIAWLLGRA